MASHKQAKYYDAGCGACRRGTVKGPENKARPEEGMGPLGPDRVRGIRPSHTGGESAWTGEGPQGRCMELTGFMDVVVSTYVLNVIGVIAGFIVLAVFGVPHRGVGRAGSAGRRGEGPERDFPTCSPSRVGLSCSLRGALPDPGRPLEESRATGWVPARPAASAMGPD